MNDLMFSCRNCEFGQFSCTWKTIFCSKKEIQRVVIPEIANDCIFYSQPKFTFKTKGIRIIKKGRNEKVSFKTKRN